MKVLINIDEDLYTRLFDNGEDGVIDMQRACNAIRNGKPLKDMISLISDLVTHGQAAEIARRLGQEG